MKPLTRWALIGMVFVVGCSDGVDLSAEDRKMVDDVWADQNEFDREAMCELLDGDSAAGRAAAYKAIEEALFGRDMDEAIATSEESGDALDALAAASTENVEAREKRAVEMVKYLRGKC